MWPAAERAAAEKRLAVYGTLAPGRKNHWVLEPLAGTWTEGTVQGRRVAAGWGNTEGFPAVELDPAGDEVVVAVFESPDLPAHWERLDAFEGDEYARVVTTVTVRDRILLANIYVVRP
jgi:gamma-glutamylcyclotransferase (GGCT)/AIG2-like uncharacterized protein YtfP